MDPNFKLALRKVVEGHGGIDKLKKAMHYILDMDKTDASIAAFLQAFADDPKRGRTFLMAAALGYSAAYMFHEATT